MPGARLAIPLTTIVRDEGWLEELAGLAATHSATSVVVGLPVSLNGTEGRAAAQARDFAAQVRTRLALPVALFDERMSTLAAGRALRAGGAGGRRARGMVDRSAAAIILQAYLDGEAPGPAEQPATHQPAHQPREPIVENS